MAARRGAVSITVLGNDLADREDQPDENCGDYQ